MVSPKTSIFDMEELGIWSSHFKSSYFVVLHRAGYVNVGKIANASLEDLYKVINLPKKDAEILFSALQKIELSPGISAEVVDEGQEVVVGGQIEEMWNTRESEQRQQKSEEQKQKLKELDLWQGNTKTSWANKEREAVD